MSANWSVRFISHYVNHRASVATLRMIFEKFHQFRWIGSFINSLAPAPVLPRRTKQPVRPKNNTVQKLYSLKKITCRVKVRLCMVFLRAYREDPICLVCNNVDLGVLY